VGDDIAIVELKIDVAGLPVGTYDCTLAASAAPAIDTPRSVAVHLLVGRVRRVPEEYGTIQAGMPCSPKLDPGVMRVHGPAAA
jgi:hypothetical protein